MEDKMKIKHLKKETELMTGHTEKREIRHTKQLKEKVESFKKYCFVSF